MRRSRITTLLTVLGLASGLGALASAPAGAVDRQPQTVSFSSTPPSGADWLSGVTPMGNIGYVATASATSGLPVTYSIAPASAAICRIDGVYQDHPVWGTGAGIEFLGAGTCTVNADQAGNDAYLPAQRVSQSFQIEKAATKLDPVKATKGLLAGTPSTFRATLLFNDIGQQYSRTYIGYPGRTVTFWVSGKPVCSAVTDSNGHATCTALLGLAARLLQTRSTVTYSGEANYKPATRTALFSLV